MLGLHVSNPKCIYAVLGFEAYLQAGSLSRIERSYCYFSYTSAGSMKKIWNIGARGNVSSVHCLVWHLRLWRQILPVSLIFKSSVYKVYSCAYISGRSTITCMYKTQKPSISEELILFFLKREDYFILPLTKSLCVNKVQCFK